MRGAPLFSGGHRGGLSRAAAPCRGTKWCWGVGFVTFPSSHRAALLWHSPTGAVTGHGVNTETHPVRSQPQPGLCHTARLGPGYLSLGPFLPLSPGLVRDSFTHRATGCACKCRLETGIFAQASSIQSSKYRGTFIPNNLQKFFLIVFTFHKS